MSFDAVNEVQFVNFSVQEVDTFYAIPSWYTPPYSDSILNGYRETTSSLTATLTKAHLSSNASLNILLKDTVTVYQVSVSQSHKEIVGRGRCAGSNFVIDSINVNGIISNRGRIVIIK